MTAGRELDALVAEKVMGLASIQRVKLKKHWEPLSPFVTSVEPVIDKTGIPPYSTSIAAAWDVVEKLKARYPQFCLQWWTSNGVEQAGGSWAFYPAEHTECEPLAHGLTAPHAICLAALKAVGVTA